MRFALLALAASLGLAQTAIPPNLPTQPLGPNDLVNVAVYRSPEFSGSLRVAADGTIEPPMLRRRVKAAGLLPRALEEVVAAELREAGLLVDPYVQVTVLEYHSRPISVAGAVRKPVTFQAVGPMTLLEALARAEGLTPDAGTDILVSAAGEIKTVPVAALLNGTDPALNLKLEGGEEIRIPEAGRIYVVGNVRKPGAYAVRDQSPVTLLKILALAEGLAPFSAKEAFLYRSKIEIPVALDKIMKRKSPDIPLTVDDILYIPDNSGKRIGLAALEKALLFGSTAGATALVWRR